jgi:hypothetical protein
LILICILVSLPGLIVPASFRLAATGVWPAIVAAIIALLALIRRSGKRLALDLQEGQLQSIEGEIDDRGDIWVASPNRMRFRFIDDSQELAPGAYRFYCLPRSHWLISAESLAFAGNQANHDTING